MFDRAPNDPKVVTASEGILDAIALETMHGEYKWSQLLKKDEVQTGKRVLLAYGMQLMNQIGGGLICCTFFFSFLVRAGFLPG